MISSIISRLIILLFGTLYPAYASYKAVKTKNFKEYVKWMMYWIVFAFFTCIETFTDVFLSWFPLYYEIKVILVFWLLSPVTRGSSILYRKFVHPMLSSREQEIDEYIALTKEQSYRQVLDLGSKGVSVLMQTALKNFNIPQIISSVSNPSIDNSKGDQIDYPQKYSPPSDTQFEVEFSSDDDNGEFYEKNVEPEIVPPKEVKKRKQRQAGTRKSARKVSKTDYNEDFE